MRWLQLSHDHRTWYGRTKGNRRLWPFGRFTCLCFPIVVQTMPRLLHDIHCNASI